MLTNTPDTLAVLLVVKIWSQDFFFEIVQNFLSFGWQNRILAMPQKVMLAALHGVEKHLLLWIKPYKYARTTTGNIYEKNSKKNIFFSELPKTTEIDLGHIAIWGKINIFKAFMFGKRLENVR